MGTIKIALTGSNEWPKLQAQIEPVPVQAEVQHNINSSMDSKRKNILEPGDLPVAIECLLYYQQYYNLN